MFPPPGSRTAAFLGCLLLGGGAGALWDLLEGARRAFRLRRGASAVLDGLYCLLVTAAVLLFLLLRTDGSLRFYLAVGGALGLLAWRGTLSRWAVPGAAWLWRALGRAAAAAVRGVLWLFSFPRGI